MANILHVIDTTGPGGAETIFVELADRLRQRGHTSIVTIRGEGWVADSLRERGLEPIFIDSNGSFNLLFLYKIFKLVRKHKIDVIQSHLLDANVYCGLLGILFRIPVIGVFHGAVDIAPDERFVFLKHTAMKFGLSRCVIVCQGLAAEIKKRGLLNPKKTTVIYNGVELARYTNSTNLELRNTLNLPATAKLAGCLGNIRPAKAYDVLINALPEIINSHPNFHVAIAGEGGNKLHKELAALAKALNVDAHIHFLGFCKDSAAFLASIDFFLLPSRTEGFPVSVIEALATGLPILATRCVGAEEILVHADNGWLIPTDDSAALVEGLNLFLTADPQLPDWKNQRETAAPFSMEKMLSEYERLYPKN